MKGRTYMSEINGILEKNNIFNVRSLTETDLPSLTQLFNYNDEAEMLRSNKEAMEKGEEEIFGLYAGERLIGELHAKYVSGDEREAVKEKRVYLFAFRVHGDFRGKGLGQHLMKKVIDILSDRGYTEFTIGVEEDNERALHIYRAFGFDKAIARKYEEYQGDGYEYDLYLKSVNKEDNKAVEPNIAHYISKDCDGNVFISFEQIGEDKIAAECSPLTHCLAVVRMNGDYLLGWNKWRSRYEVFGGCREEKETPRECVIRECGEELGIVGGDFVYLGVMKFLLSPDYFSSKERIEYGALYGITLPDGSPEEIYSGVRDKAEIKKIALYRDVKGKETIADIDEKLFDFYK